MIAIVRHKIKDDIKYLAEEIRALRRAIVSLEREISLNRSASSELYGQKTKLVQIKEALTERVFNLHVAYAYDSGKLHAKHVSINRMKKIHQEVNGWYEFWYDDNNSQ